LIYKILVEAFDVVDVLFAGVQCEIQGRT
jgi:hypothetical protein